MSLLKHIKEAAKNNRTKIQSSEAQELEQKLNSLFLLPKKPKQEAKFVQHVLSKGLQQTERIGLHASSLITSDKEFCIRAQVLSLFYKQSQGEQHKVDLLRIFEEGNAIHEKWQRLFIRGGWSKYIDLDTTQYNKKYMISFTPDALCLIPDYRHCNKEVMIGEIKSVNTFQFQKMVSHPTAKKQLQWYMFLTGIKNGFVLCEDKNTQEIKVEVYKYDAALVEEYIDRAKTIKQFYNEIKESKSSKDLPNKPKDANNPTCKRCSKCHMTLSCWGLPGGRVKLASIK